MLEELTRFVDPTADQNTIAVYKLDEANFRIECSKERETFIACTRCSKGPGGIQCGYARPNLFRRSNAAIS
jgi:hypothetical protein